MEEKDAAFASACYQIESADPEADDGDWTECCPCDRENWVSAKGISTVKLTEIEYGRGEEDIHGTAGLLPGSEEEATLKNRTGVPGTPQYTPVHRGTPRY